MKLSEAIPGVRSILPRLVGVMLMAGASGLCADEPASFTVDARLGEGSVEELQVRLDCRAAGDAEPSAVQSARLPRDGTAIFEVVVPPAASWACDVFADALQGMEVRYRGDGGSDADIGESGCRFTGVRAGHANFCQIQTRSQVTSITVYKKWIGGSGEEQDVRVSLECESGEYSGVRYINEGSPNGWDITDIDPEGILCNVQEAVRETYRPDIIDCQGLLVLPGKGEECTMVNTKIVKRIEMLNRYGKVVMTVLVLLIGLLAVKRLSPP